MFTSAPEVHKQADVQVSADSDSWPMHGGLIVRIWGAGEHLRCEYLHNVLLAGQLPSLP
jgi:hypothetical protein